MQPEVRPDPFRRMAAGLRSRSTWMGTANLVVSLAVGGLFASMTATAFVFACLTVWIVGVGVVFRAAAFRLAAWCAGMDRRRLELLGERVEVMALPGPPPGASFRQRQVVWGRAHGLWPLPGYQLARLVLASAVAFVGVAWWWSIVVIFMLAAGTDSPVLLLGWSVGRTDPNPFGAFVLIVAGLLAIGLWPAVVRASVVLDALVANAILGPSRSGQLSAEVTRLGRARDLAVEAAEGERRRIERDLHDGLQPQLVNLALDLGLARSRLDRDPEAVRAMVERAHEEAKRATEDLRNLVRGIHPSVLDERGLDAALSALVAGCPIPVEVEVEAQLADGLDPTREATAYYVVAEAITNITKHSGARSASVAIRTEESAMRVVVEDDGRGGAHLEPGGGLTGLAARVGSLDGTLSVSSPPGGPTCVEAVIPCGP